MFKMALFSDADRPLSRPAYMVLAIACAIMGAWASIITLRYFKHGAMILEADDASRVLALAAATMFVFAEMGAFGLFSLLPAQRMYDLRWKLITFVVAVLALEVVTVVAVQMAMTKSADMTQQTGAQRAQDLRRQIAQAEEAATALRAQSAQLANAEHAWVKAGAPKLAAMAASATAKTDGLYAELAKVDSTQHPTLIGLFGEDWAMAYAIARGILVSCAGLVFWGAVGVLLRAFSAAGQAHENHHQPQPPYEVLPAPQPAPPAPQPAPPAPQPAPPAPPPAPQPAPPAPQPNPYTPDWAKWGNAKVGAAALAIGAATTAIPSTADAAPTAPAMTLPSPTKPAQNVPEQVHANVPEQVQANVPEQVHANVPEQVHANVPEQVQANVPEQVQANAPEQVQANVPEQVQANAPEQVQRRSATAGVKIDTGVGRLDGFRYRRVRSAVKAGRLKPSIRAIKLAEGGRDDVVRGYLTQMEKEGLLERMSNGRWRLKA